MLHKVDGEDLKNPETTMDDFTNPRNLTEEISKRFQRNGVENSLLNSITFVKLIFRITYTENKE